MDGPTSMHTQAALTRQWVTLKRHEGASIGRAEEVGGGIWVGYDQDTLHSCMKLPNDKNSQKIRNIFQLFLKHLYV